MDWFITSLVVPTPAEFSLHGIVTAIALLAAAVPGGVALRATLRARLGARESAPDVCNAMRWRRPQLHLRRLEQYGDSAGTAPLSRLRSPVTNSLSEETGHALRPVDLR